MPDTPGASLTREQVAHLADLARIDLSDAELDHLAPQLGVILDSIASIQGVAGDDVPPTSHALPMTNVFREDVVVPGLTADEALALLARGRARLHEDVRVADPEAAPVNPPAGREDEYPTQGDVLLHVYEELAQHLGQLEVTRDLLLARRP